MTDAKMLNGICNACRKGALQKYAVHPTTTICIHILTVNVTVGFTNTVMNKYQFVCQQAVLFSVKKKYYIHGQIITLNEVRWMVSANLSCQCVLLKMHPLSYWL